MGKAAGLTLLSLLLVAGSANLSRAAECAFSKWQDFKGTTVFRHDVAKAYQHQNNVTVAKAYYYEIEDVVFAVDGAPNAYHPDDVGKDCEKDEHIGLDCPSAVGYPDTDWWSDLLVPDPDMPSQAYVQKDGPFKGFFVSMTWLSGEGPETDPSNYVDATNIPYIVSPGPMFQKLGGTGDKGDVGIAWNLENGKSAAFVVADLGDDDDSKLGKGSIALFEALGGEDVNVRLGTGAAPGKMRFLVFPDSGKLVNPVWPRTKSEIEKQALYLLAQMGGEVTLEGCK